METSRPNPGNDGEKPQTCSICGALLVCLSCGNHRDEELQQARARIAELEQQLEIDRQPHAGLVREKKYG